MALTILNNIASIAAENQLTITSNNLQTTLFQLSSGSRINSGADDAAGLAIANGLQANVTALTQSARNANDGVGALQVADGSLAQVTTLLNRAVTLATEASTGTVSNSQRGALDAEFTQIKNEINRIGTSTNYNGSQVFSANTLNIFLSDSARAVRSRQPRALSRRRAWDWPGPQRPFSVPPAMRRRLTLSPSAAKPIHLPLQLALLTQWPSARRLPRRWRIWPRPSTAARVRAWRMEPAPAPTVARQLSSTRATTASF